MRRSNHEINIGTAEMNSDSPRQREREKDGKSSFSMLEIGCKASLLQYNLSRCNISNQYRYYFMLMCCSVLREKSF